ncbi:helix-turn-helix domain-containing protein (plasmid) [Streptomyces anulatus]|uniref:helix-turn-helix domain-containing protein n=1 Tax=Streptomyces anulatus TaxID=1892 RepID=UPI003253E585
MAHAAARRWISSGRDARDHVKPRIITPQQADEIRARTTDGETLKDLALEYGVSVATIRRYSN